MNIRHPFLIVGGLHGDEPSGIEIVTHLAANPLPGIVPLLANPAAVRRGVRYIETDMNRSFSPPIAMSLEEQRARQIRTFVSHCRAVIDIHNTRASRTTCAITVCNPTPFHIKMACHFGFSRIVVMPPSGSLISCASSQAISLEIAQDDQRQYSLQFLQERLRRLTNGTYPTTHLPRLRIYRYVRSVPTTTVYRLGLTTFDIDNFKPIDTKVSHALGLDSQTTYSAIFSKSPFDNESAFTLVAETG